MENKELNGFIVKMREHCISQGDCETCERNSKDIHDFCQFNFEEYPEYWGEIKEPIKLKKLAKEALELAKEFEFEYIAKDRNGDVWLYSGKPYKDETYWESYNARYNLRRIRKLFPFLSWEDEEPTKINDVLGNYIIIEEKGE